MTNSSLTNSITDTAQASGGFTTALSQLTYELTVPLMHEPAQEIAHELNHELITDQLTHKHGTRKWCFYNCAVTTHSRTNEPSHDFTHKPTQKIAHELAHVLVFQHKRPMSQPNH